MGGGGGGGPIFGIYSTAFVVVVGVVASVVEAD